MFCGELPRGGFLVPDFVGTKTARALLDDSEKV